MLSLARTSWSTLKKQPVIQKTLSALYWLPVAIVVSEYFFSVKLVNGTSMQPTLNPDRSLWRDLVVFDRFSPRIVQRRYERGDVVALWSPSDPKRMLVKRILALEGDVVKTLPPYPDTEVCIPPGHVWVEGDEPFRSDDSNRFGPASLALLDARLVFILWPLNRWGSVYHGRRRETAASERESWRNSRVAVVDAH